MTACSEVRFPVYDGVELGAWLLYLPKSDAQRCPGITMASAAKRSVRAAACRWNEHEQAAGEQTAAASAQPVSEYDPDDR